MSGAVARGTRYELHVQCMLRSIGIRTRRRGGAGDGGVDLVGRWTSSHDMSPEDRQCRVLIQCKHLSNPLGPSVVRELISALSHWSTPAASDTPSHFIFVPQPPSPQPHPIPPVSVPIASVGQVSEQTPCAFKLDNAVSHYDEACGSVAFIVCSGGFSIATKRWVATVSVQVVMQQGYRFTRPNFVFWLFKFTCVRVCVFKQTALALQALSLVSGTSNWTPSCH